MKILSSRFADVGICELSENALPESQEPKKSLPELPPQTLRVIYSLLNKKSRRSLLQTCKKVYECLSCWFESAVVDSSAIAYVNNENEYPPNPIYPDLTIFPNPDRFKHLERIEWKTYASFWGLVTYPIPLRKIPIYPHLKVFITSPQLSACSDLCVFLGKQPSLKHLSLHNCGCIQGSSLRTLFQGTAKFESLRFTELPYIHFDFEEEYPNLSNLTSFDADFDYFNFDLCRALSISTAKELDVKICKKEETSSNHPLLSRLKTCSVELSRENLSVILKQADQIEKLIVNGSWQNLYTSCLELDRGGQGFKTRPYLSSLAFKIDRSIYPAQQEELSEEEHIPFHQFKEVLNFFSRVTHLALIEFNIFNYQSLNPIDFENLQTLEIDRSNSGDGNLRWLLLKAKKIERIKIKYCPRMTDEILNILPSETLVSLELSGVFKLTKQFVHNLVKSCGNLKELALYPQRGWNAFHFYELLRGTEHPEEMYLNNASRLNWNGIAKLTIPIDWIISQKLSQQIWDEVQKLQHLPRPESDLICDLVDQAFTDTSRQLPKLKNLKTLILKACHSIPLNYLTVIAALLQNLRTIELDVISYENDPRLFFKAQLLWSKFDLDCELELDKSDFNSLR